MTLGGNQMEYQALVISTERYDIIPKVQSFCCYTHQANLIPPPGISTNAIITNMEVST